MPNWLAPKSTMGWCMTALLAVHRTNSNLFFGEWNYLFSSFWRQPDRRAWLSEPFEISHKQVNNSENN